MGAEPGSGGCLDALLGALNLEETSVMRASAILGELISGSPPELGAWGAKKLETKPVKLV